MSLANVLGRFAGRHQVVLLGDPQQLEQPMQGAIRTGRTYRRSITSSPSTRRSP